MAAKKLLEATGEGKLDGKEAEDQLKELGIDEAVMEEGGKKGRKRKKQNLTAQGACFVSFMVTVTLQS